MKKNCWEFKGCGREPGGREAGKHGECPASTEKRMDGFHGGKNAGRACWVVAGTMCMGKPQGTFAQKYRDCGLCEFYNKVKQEEKDLVPTILLLEILEELTPSKS